MLRDFHKLTAEDESWNFDEELPTLATAPEANDVGTRTYESRSATFWERKAGTPKLRRYNSANSGDVDEEGTANYVSPRDTQAPELDEGDGSTGRKAPPASSVASHVNRTFEVEMVLCLLLLGVSTSLAAWAMDSAIQGFHRLQWLIGSGPSVVSSIFLVYLSVMVTFVISPLAAGSGIPEMKAALAGFEKRIPSPLTLSPSGIWCGRSWDILPSCRPSFFGLRTLVAKVLGCIFAIGGRLPVGKEGPFVHTAGILACQILELKRFRRLRRTPELRHQLISAAAAVGVASAFGAPIGGVLFSVEATASLYLTESYWPTFFCATAGACVGHLLNLSELAMFQPKLGDMGYASWEMAIFALLALLGGLLGGLYTLCFTRIVSWRARNETRIWERIARVVLPTRRLRDRLYNWAGWGMSRQRMGALATSVTVAGVVAGVVAICLYVDRATYLVLNMRDTVDDLFQKGPLSASRQKFVVPTNNGPEEEEVEQYLHSSRGWGSGGILIANLFVFLMYTFLTSCVAISLPISNGLVTPAFAMGAAFGRLFGESVHLIAIAAGSKTVLAPAAGYALVGSAAMASAITGKISIAVVIFELTANVSFGLPVLMASLLGKSAGETLTPDIYTMIARIKHLPHWPVTGNGTVHMLRVRDVMTALPPPNPSGVVHAKSTERELRSVLGRTEDDVALAVVEASAEESSPWKRSPVPRRRGLTHADVRDEVEGSARERGLPRVQRSRFIGSISSSHVRKLLYATRMVRNSGYGAHRERERECGRGREREWEQLEREQRDKGNCKDKQSRGRPPLALSAKKEGLVKKGADDASEELGVAEGNLIEIAEDVNGKREKKVVVVDGEDSATSKENRENNKNDSNSKSSNTALNSALGVTPRSDDPISANAEAAQADADVGVDVPGEAVEAVSTAAATPAPMMDLFSGVDSDSGSGSDNDDSSDVEEALMDLSSGSGDTDTAADREGQQVQADSDNDDDHDTHLAASAESAASTSTSETAEREATNPLHEASAGATKSSSSVLASAAVAAAGDMNGSSSNDGGGGGHSRPALVGGGGASKEGRSNRSRSDRGDDEIDLTSARGNVLGMAACDQSVLRVGGNMRASKVALLFAVSQQERIFVVDECSGELLGFVDRRTMDLNYRHR